MFFNNSTNQNGVSLGGFSSSNSDIFSCAALLNAYTSYAAAIVAYNVSFFVAVNAVLPAAKFIVKNSPTAANYVYTLSCSAVDIAYKLTSKYCNHYVNKQSYAGANNTQAISYGETPGLCGFSILDVQLQQCIPTIQYSE